MSDDLSIDERIALARAPISVGILATLGSSHIINGKSSGGCGSDGSKSPIVGRRGDVVGWQRNAQKQR